MCYVAGLGYAEQAAVSRGMMVPLALESRSLLIGIDFIAAQLVMQ